MTVTRIDEYTARDTVMVLRELLVRAESGRMHGLVFCFKSAPHRHRYGFAGQYRSNPVEALGCITRMEYKVNQLISAADGEPDTRTMAL